LQKGTHSVTVYHGFQYRRVNERYDVTAYNYVNFTINVPVNFPPRILVYSPVNGLYYASNVPLSFVVEKQISRAMYSLDGNVNVTLAGNTTLNNLSLGEHSVTIYAEDTAGNIGVSNPVHFTIYEPVEKPQPKSETKPEPDPFPTMLEAVTFIVAIATLSMLLSTVYFKKRKHQSIPSSTIPNNN
jgi:hypothetical protein